MNGKKDGSMFNPQPGPQADFMNRAIKPMLLYGGVIGGGFVSDPASYRLRNDGFVIPVNQRLPK